MNPELMGNLLENMVRVMLALACRIESTQINPNELKLETPTDCCIIKVVTKR